MSKARKRQARGAHSEMDDWARSVGSLPFQGRVSRRAFDKALRQLMVYEDWVAAGRPDTVEHVSKLPSWYLGASYWNDTAFQYLRHAAWAYLRFAGSGPTYGGTFRSIVRRMRETSPTKYGELVEVVRQNAPHFERQHRNAGRASRRAMQARDDQQQLEVVLQWYVSFFETNLYAWFLCVLARFLSTGEVDAGAFGGPDTRASQGSLVRRALDDLAGTPLQEVVRAVYDTQMRNSLSHNDYELTSDPTRTLVLHPGPRTFTWDEVWRLLVLAQDIHEGLLSAIATVMTAPAPDDWYYLREYGVTSLDWTATDDGPVIVILHQLWCFAELDPDGCWLDSGELTIEQIASPDMSAIAAIRFGTAGLITVPIDERLDALKRILRRQPWVIATRYPVAPYLGLRYPRYGKELEVVGTADEHLVRYRGENVLDPRTLPPRTAAAPADQSA